jgi:DNA-binding beta-propeller fold protein YncE
MQAGKFSVYMMRLAMLILLTVGLRLPAAAERHLLYVAVPGIRNETRWGGVGILVFDIDHGHRLLKRIPTLKTETGQEPEAVKGICASARTGKLYVSTPKRLLCLDLTTEQILWNRTYDGGCDRMAISPDGATLYVPSLEGPHWNVVAADTGDPLAKIDTNSGSHNTICGLDGRFAYLAGLKSPLLYVADTKTHKVARTVGPFSNVIRPFTVNGKCTLCFVTVNDLLGFEVGDLNTGKKLYRVEVTGYSRGDVKRHGCPSHGIGLTPDEKELWLNDSFNSRVHIFDATKMPPQQIGSIPLRDQPGWITFSLDGKYAYPSTGEVIDTRTKRIVATLADEQGQPVQSEKMVEVVFDGAKPTRAGDQFGLGRHR